MNIFEALTLGNVGIREPNITAVLGYLLISSRNHSMDDALLLELIKIINLTNKKVEKKINLEDYDSSEIDIEHTYKDKVVDTEKERTVDIQIKLINSENKTFHRIIIENKIKDGGGEDTSKQLQDEYDLECKESINSISNNYDTKDVSITVLFITHSNCSRKFDESYDALSVGNSDGKRHIYWSSDNKDDHTIYNAILAVIEKDQLTKINPIHSCALHTIKSFARHIKSIGARDTPKRKTTQGCIEPRERQSRYHVVKRMEELKVQLQAANICNDNDNDNGSFTDLDTSDCRITSFYCKITDNFRICIQALNRNDMKIRVLIRPVPQPKNIHPNNADKKKLKDFCDDNTHILECMNGGAYAYIAKDDNKNIYEGDTDLIREIQSRVINLKNIFLKPSSNTNYINS